MSVNLFDMQEFEDDNVVWENAAEDKLGAELHIMCKMVVVPRVICKAASSAEQKCGEEDLFLDYITHKSGKWLHRSSAVGIHILGNLDVCFWKYSYWLELLVHLNYQVLFQIGYL